MKPERLIDLGGAVLVALVLAVGVMNLVRDPLAKDRAWMAEQRENDGLKANDDLAAANNFQLWQDTIASRPDVWAAISPTPAPPPPPPPAPCAPPSESDLMAKVQGEVKFTKQQIGKKIKVLSAESKKGDFYAEGDTLKLKDGAFVVKSFDRTSVTLVFTFKCPDKTSQEIEVNVPRE